jgi:hypothetical protein
MRSKSIKLSAGKTSVLSASLTSAAALIVDTMIPAHITSAVSRRRTGSLTRIEVIFATISISGTALQKINQNKAATRVARSWMIFLNSANILQNMKITPIP